MFRRLASFLLLIWLFGFVWFAVSLPGPVPARVHTDAIIVLTGSQGRIEHAIEMLKAGAAPRMLVSGVGREVQPAEFAAKFGVPAQLMACCVTLGYLAYDTRSNAVEAAQWVAQRHARSLRLVTADWHMRRATMELQRQLRPGLRIVEDGVPSHPTLGVLFLEYHKLLARTVLSLVKR